MSYERYDENGRMLCIFNAGSENAGVPLPRGYSYNECGVVLSTSDECKIDDKNVVEVPAMNCVFIRATAKTREVTRPTPAF